MSSEEQTPYEKQSRDHMARQGVIKQSIIDALQKKKGGSSSRSFLSVQKVSNSSA
jgi:hypothetical protein